MKIEVTRKIEVEVKTLHVKAGARYWEDSSVNGVEDTNGDLMPCIEGDYWCPIIDIDTGQILNWEKGKTADVHYKVCDDGIYTLKDSDGFTVLEHEGYVRDCMEPKENGYGDYIIMDIDENGFIKDWEADFSDFQPEEE